MRDMVDEYYQSADLKPDPLFETSSTKTILRVVENGLSVGFVPQSYVCPSQKIVFFTTGRHYEWMLTIAHRKGYYLSNAEREFIRIFKDMYQTSHGQQGA